MAYVLVVEDDAALAEGLCCYLEAEGFRVRLAGCAAEALTLAGCEAPDLIILDLGLPDRDGFDVLRTLRGRGCDSPVLILSGRGMESDKLQGFRLGADDYVTKPFGIRELMARAGALLRRVPAAAPPAPGAPDEVPDEELRERYGLTARQVAVARLLGKGYANREIARLLGISPFTARNHTDQVLAKMGTSSRARVGAILRRRA